MEEGIAEQAREWFKCRTQTDAEIEENRQRRLNELLEDAGWDLAMDKYGPGSFGFHEALHTASIVMEMFDQYVLEHPSIVSDPVLYLNTARAFDALFEVYQNLGARQV